VNASSNDRPSGRRGGLNFWQWLGIAIIVIAGLIYLYRNLRSEPEPTPQQQDQSAPGQAQRAGELPASTQSAQ